MGRVKRKNDLHRQLQAKFTKQCQEVKQNWIWLESLISHIA